MNFISNANIATILQVKVAELTQNAEKGVNFNSHNPSASAAA